mgnify:FL=1
MSPRGIKNPPFEADFYYLLLVFFVAYVLFLFGAELEVGDGSYEGINTESKGSEPEIRAGSAGVSFGLKTGVVDDDTADPTEEEGK